ncbi:hypothetical protein AAG587_17580 [Vreelandella neptunia]|uniref:hypothetical protein n=1 Tax=Vreelandella neptunia TaxID=115551 RepID=UPI00315AAC8D
MTEDALLTLNAGSSSLKFALFGAVLAQRADIPKVACFDTVFHQGLPGIGWLDRHSGDPPRTYNLEP